MSARLASLILANSMLLGASLGFIAPSFAAIYMKLGDIKGEATESNHKGWIEIDLRFTRRGTSGRRSKRENRCAERSRNHLLCQTRRFIQRGADGVLQDHGAP